MLKFVAHYYYLIVGLVLLYFTFNVTIRNSLIEKYFNPEGAAYSMRMVNINNYFIYALYFILLLLFILSIALLLSQHGKTISKIVLLIIPTLIFLFFLSLTVLGAFSDIYR